MSNFTKHGIQDTRSSIIRKRGLSKSVGLTMRNACGMYPILESGQEVLDNFLERTKEGHRQSDEHWKATTGKLLRDGAESIWAFPSA